MKTKSSQSGFTLVEMMVSVAIFTIVALVVSGTFLLLAQSYRQIRINRTITDNLHFALDTLSLQIGDGDDHVILNEGTEINFTENRLQGDDDAEDTISYRLNGVSLEQGRNGVFVPFISPEIEVDHLQFSRVGNRLIKIEIGGRIPSLRRVAGDFFVETAVYPRD